MVFLRVGFSLLIATIVGWVFSTQADLRPLLQPSIARMLPAPVSKDKPDLLQSGTFLLGAGQPMRLDPGTVAAIAENPVLSKPMGARVQLMFDNMVQELRELGGVLILGSAIAAIVQVAAPREVILSLGQGVVTSIVAMMVLAAVVSICSTVDAFFALSFASTFTSGALLAFLVFGPMIDLKNIGLLLTVFRGRTIAYLFILAAQLTFLLTLLINVYGG
jgi:hypothetical protein